MTTPAINIMSYLVTEHDFERMQAYNSSGIAGLNSYHEFLGWNIACVNALSELDRFVLEALCAQLNAGAVNLVDMESCVEWAACGFYYNQQKALCIIHPR